MPDPIERLYIDHHGWIYHWLKRRLNNNQDAADLAQDTFVRLLKRRHEYYYHQPRALLTTIANGLLINWYQRQYIEKAYLQSLAAEPNRFDEISPEQQVQAIEALCLLSNVLQQLPKRQRQCLIWSQLEGLSQHEIAQRQGVSTRTVMRDLLAAISLCLAQIEDD